METTYIYALVDPRDGNTRYIGKTNNPRLRLKSHFNKSRHKNTYKFNWINSLRELGLKPILEIIDEVPKSEWKYWERFWIYQFKQWGFNLTNSTSGGNGLTFGNSTSYKKGNKNLLGYKHSEETKELISNLQKGRLGSHNAKKVLVKDLKGNLLFEKISVKNCAKSLGISEKMVRKCCDGKIDNYDNLIFEYKIPKIKKKVLIIGSKRHGKDCLAEMIKKQYGLKHLSSSVAALKIFLFDVLRDKYNLHYNSMEEAYEDRVNHRDKWYSEICEYNKDNPIKLTLEILKEADIYVGLRDYKEIEKAIDEGIFDLIIGIHDYRKPFEDKSSNTIDIFKYSDIIITNNGNLSDLRKKVNKFLPLI